MITLAAYHPARLAVGAARAASLRAADPVQQSMCADAVRFSAASRDLHAEIATDAHYLLDRMAAAVADGQVTPAEIAEIRALAAEIESEATTGRIQPGSGA